MRISYTYHQRAIVEVSGVLEVPAKVLAAGRDAVHEYIRDHESDATSPATDIVDWQDEVFDTMDYEEA